MRWTPVTQHKQILLTQLLPRILFFLLPFPRPRDYHHSCQLNQWTSIWSFCFQSLCLSSVQFSDTVMSYSLRPHGQQHARLPSPSPTHRACSDSCPLNRWWHPTILSSAIPFSSCLLSFPASGSFPISRFCALGSQNIRASASAPGFQWINRVDFLQNWLVLSPTVQGTLKSLLQHHNSKASILQHSAFFIVQLSHPYMTTGKTITLTRWTIVGKIMSLLFNMLSKFVIAFLPSSKHLLISWRQSPS